MMTLSPTLTPLIKSHRLPLYSEQLATFLDAERKRRDDFYDWVTEDTRAEFINGEVVVQSPAKDRHTEAVANLASLLKTYVDIDEVGIVRPETALVTLTRNDYLPDICYFGEEKASRISSSQMKYPPPDFIIEVLSPSTEKTDRTTKFDDYADHGVWEYWLVDTETETVEQYLLRDGRYELHLKVNAGTLTSDIVEGFEIPVKAIFDRKAKNRALAAMLA